MARPDRNGMRLGTWSPIRGPSNAQAATPQRRNAAALPTADPRLRVLNADATDAEALAEAVATAAGSAGLDNLTCCVGVFESCASRREIREREVEAAAEEWWRVNVFSVLQAAYPELARARGSVTPTLSESAFHPVGEGVLYGAANGRCAAPSPVRRWIWPPRCG
ncbi:SDR family NAD(P)-dependent oxidoreductase [Streptomyces sp. NPDC056930]|uniref:SDR family NAD(P)-dependent oxidoreductase n=1 Tax=Streptomyces sp. NPDC056930 TaxID=3345967 RepID=UPI00363B4E7F